MAGAAMLLAVAAGSAAAYSQEHSPGEAQTSPRAAKPAPDPHALFEEAQAAQQSGDKELAVKKYEELIRFHPEVVAAHADLGVVLVSLGRYDEGIAQYHIALTEAPGSPPLRLNLGLAYYKKGDFAGAAAQFASLHKEQPNDARLATLLAKCETQIGLAGQALALLEPLEKQHPDNLDVEWALGNALLSTGQTLEGLKRVQKVADEGHSEQAYQLAADLYLGLAMFDIAKRDAEAVLRLDAKAAKAYVVLGIVDDYAGNEKAAAEQYEKALEIDPNDLQARIQLASALYGQRKLDEAKRELERALAMDPQAYGARYEMARVEQAQGNMTAALKDLETVVQQRPDWLEPHVDLAALYYRLKRPADGARERQIVDRLREQEQKRRGQAKIISPQIHSQ